MEPGPRKVDRKEEEILQRMLRERSALECPRCTSRLLSQSFGPRSDVAYVRDRVLLFCTSCDLRAVIDRV